MVRASLATQTLADDLVIPPSLSPAPTSQDRISASQRLGPTFLPEETIPPEIIQSVPVPRRKPGRPAGKKSWEKSTALPGGPSRKRKVRQVVLSPKKRIFSSSARAAGSSRSQNSGLRTSQTSRQAGTSSAQLPELPRFVPAMKKKTSDFHNPSCLLP